jgi:hypothetical protein
MVSYINDSELNLFSGTQSHKIKYSTTKYTPELTGNPTITFFKLRYERYTNFSVENITKQSNYNITKQSNYIDIEKQKHILAKKSTKNMFKEQANYQKQSYQRMNKNINSNYR